MANLLQFPEGAARAAFQPVQSTYSVREIARQFGLGEALIRRWTREGLIAVAPGCCLNEPVFDFRALQQFRRVRELRARGASLQAIARELCGQLALFPESVPALIQLPVRLSPFEQALLLFDTRDPRAAEMFRKAIQESEAVADAYCNLGILEFEAGHLIQSFDCVSQALREDPRHFEAHYNLANLYFEMGDYRLARQHYEIAGTLEPNFPNVYFNLGLVNALTGELRAAVSLMKKYKALASEQEALRAAQLIARFEGALAATAASSLPQ